MKVLITLPYLPQGNHDRSRALISHRDTVILFRVKPSKYSAYFVQGLFRSRGMVFEFRVIGVGIEQVKG